MSRKASGYMNYPGDCRDGFDESVPYGPNVLGEYLFVVSVEYDGKKTRVGWSLIPPEKDDA